MSFPGFQHNASAYCLVEHSAEPRSTFNLTMKSILVLEGNSPELVAASRARTGMSSAEMYGRALESLDPTIKMTTAAPYERSLTEDELQNIDGVVLTGSGVQWSTDAPEAESQRQAVSMVFDKGIPTFGSCNGMQLAAVILGGQVGASPHGKEVGLALDINKTEIGKQHPLLMGRMDGYAVPCVHRDEVQKLPEKAEHLAENAHSPIQAFAYKAEGVDFWGVQYHPEYTTACVAELMRTPGTLWQNSAQADLLEIADTDLDAARKLGVHGDDLTPAVRMTELKNWLNHLEKIE